MCLIAATAFGHLGGSLDMNGMTSFENFGLDLRLLILPPTTMATPSRSGSLMLIGGHTVKQLPQYMHFSALIFTLLFAGSGLMARVGQEPITVGSSHMFL